MKRQRYESTEQIEFVARARMVFPSVIMFAIPNGGKRGKVEATRLKREGVLAGVPDLLVAEARGGWHGLFIEMKRKNGGRVSQSQSEMLSALQKAGYACEVCYGCEDAWSALERYMKHERTGSGSEDEAMGYFEMRPETHTQSQG